MHTATLGKEVFRQPGVTSYGNKTGGSGAALATAAAVAVQFLNPATNVNGCIVRRAYVNSNNAANGGLLYMGAGPAPASIFVTTHFCLLSSVNQVFTDQNIDLLIPAGWGIWFISSAGFAGNAGVIWDLL